MGHTKAEQFSQPLFQSIIADRRGCLLLCVLRKAASRHAGRLRLLDCALCL